jgi:hypothetical protein
MGGAVRSIPEKPIVEIHTPRWRNSMNNLLAPLADFEDDDDNDNDDNDNDNDNNNANGVINNNDDDDDDNDDKDAVQRRLLTQSTPTLSRSRVTSLLTPSDVPHGHVSRWHELSDEDETAAAPTSNDTNDNNHNIANNNNNNNNNNNDSKIVDKSTTTDTNNIENDDDESSSEQSNSETYASNHFHHEIDERRVLLSPLFSKKDGTWVPSKGCEKQALRYSTQKTSIATLIAVERYDADDVRACVSPAHRYLIAIVFHTHTHTIEKAARA